MNCWCVCVCGGGGGGWAVCVWEGVGGGGSCGVYSNLSVAARDAVTGRNATDAAFSVDVRARRGGGVVIIAFKLRVSTLHRPPSLAT